MNCYPVLHAEPDINPTAMTIFGLRKKDPEIVMCGWDVETTFVSPPVRPTFCKAEDEESADFGAQKYGRSPGKCEVQYGIEFDLPALRMGLYF